MVYYVEMKYLGIDFGLRRIGLATSEGNLASPLKIIKVKGFKGAVEKIIQETQEGDFDKIIVGLSEGKMGETISGFVNALKKQGLDVETTDETLSTHQAISQMVESNVPKAKRQRSDATAATIILQDWLDSR